VNVPRFSRATRNPPDGTKMPQSEMAALGPSPRVKRTECTGGPKAGPDVVGEEKDAASASTDVYTSRVGKHKETQHKSKPHRTCCLHQAYYVDKSPLLTQKGT
jgi:hypothetical protein